MRVISAAFVLSVAASLAVSSSRAQEPPLPVPVAFPPSVAGVAVRSAPAAGAIVAAKGGEEVLFVAERGWRPALVTQAVLAGDTLRTGAIGTLALLFSDRTQMRVGRNSTLVVKAAAAAGPTELSLTEGAVWARAQRGGGAVIIDTPAATTAIRGTDWSVNVDGARTTLTVFEGVVEMTNPQGTLTVSAGEAAMATIGGAPTRVYGVNPPDRQQMHYYRTLRDVFDMLPASPLGRREMRAVRARLEAIPPAARSAEEWLTLAEVSLAVTGRQAAAAALAQARAQPLSAAQQARADLLEALIAGSELRYREAQRLFEAAEPRLDGRRRASAVYGRFFAAALADPTVAVDPPSEALAATDPYAALARAWLAGFTDGLEAELEVLRAAEARFPDAVVLPAERVQTALLLDRRDEMREAAERARAIDPDDRLTLYAEATVASRVILDSDMALAKARAAAATAPGDSAAWNEVGNAESERDAVREAQIAYQRAIEADPQNAVAYANYANWLLDRNRPRDAKPAIDSALTLDPTIAAVYDNLGRYYLQTGEEDLAVETLLKATAIDPADATSLRDLAIALYQAGEREQAIQQIDNANRLDPSDPVPWVVKTGIAYDALEADEAIRSSREALARYRARSDYESSVLAYSRKAGSYLIEPYRMLNLNAWGRYYADREFDPFQSAGYFDQVISGPVDPIYAPTPVGGPDVGNFPQRRSRDLELQGFLLDPLAVSARNRWTDFLRRPFLDTDIGGGLTSRDNGTIGWQGNAVVQGFSNATTPVSFRASVDTLSLPGRERNSDFALAAGDFAVGWSPTLYDRVFVFADLTWLDPAMTGQKGSFATPNDENPNVETQAGIGWSHTFAHNNVLTAAISANGFFEQRYQETYDLQDTLIKQRETYQQRGVEPAIAYAVEVGDVIVRTGLEGEASASQSWMKRTRYRTDPPNRRVFRDDDGLDSARTYLDLLYKPVPALQFEAGAFGTWWSDNSTTQASLNPRLGVAFEPVEGQWLRAMYRRDVDVGESFSLAPVNTLGLSPPALPLAFGGSMDTLAARWDAEWTDRLFTSLEYQHVDVEDMSVGIPRSFSSFFTARGRLDRLTATANIWAGHNIGLFGSYTYQFSHDDSASGDQPLPMVPEALAALGATWVHPSGFIATLSENYVGERRKYRTGRYTNGGFFTTDFVGSWLSPTRHLMVDVSVYNIFDEQNFVAGKVEGPGRTFLAALRAKF